MEIKLNIDDGYMQKLTMDLGLNVEQCTMEAIGILRWLADRKKSGQSLYLADKNGGPLQKADIPALDHL